MKQPNRVTAKRPRTPGVPIGGLPKIKPTLPSFTPAFASEVERAQAIAVASIHRKNHSNHAMPAVSRETIAAHSKVRAPVVQKPFFHVEGNGQGVLPGYEKKPIQLDLFDHRPFLPRTSSKFPKMVYSFDKGTVVLEAVASGRIYRCVILRDGEKEFIITPSGKKYRVVGTKLIKD